MWIRCCGYASNCVKTNFIFYSFCLFFSILMLNQEGAKLVKKIKGIFKFVIKNSNGQEAWWIVDAKNGDGALKFMASGKRFVARDF